MSCMRSSSGTFPTQARELLIGTLGELIVENNETVTSFWGDCYFFMPYSYLVSENFSDTPKSLVDVGYDEADTTGILV